MRGQKHGIGVVLGALSGLAVVSFLCAGCAEKVTGGRNDQPEGVKLVVDSREPNVIERPAWIDSDTIVFSWNQDTPTDQLYTVKVSGGNPVRLIQDNPRTYLHPSYSAGAGMIAFEVIDNEFSGSNIDAVRPDGTRRIRYAAGTPVNSNQYPCWGPGAKSIGYLLTSNEPPRFVMLELDDSYDPPRPTGNTAQIDFEQGFQPSRTIWYAPAESGPFSGKVAYNRIPPAAEGGTEIYYYDLDSSVEVRLTNEDTPDADNNINPSWSPDGAHIVYSTDYRTTQSPEFGRDLFVISVSSKAAIRLTRTGSIETDPAWSPDGGLIAYVAGGDLYVLTVDPTKLPE